MLQTWYVSDALQIVTMFPKHIPMSTKYQQRIKNAHASSLKFVEAEIPW